MIGRNIALSRWYSFFNGFRPYEAIAVLYFAQVTGSFARASMIFSIASIVSLVLEVPTGVISDHIGRRKTLVYAAIAGLVGIILYTVGGSFLILALGAASIGLSWALASGNNDALLYDTLKQTGELERLSENFGKMSAFFQASLAISALFAALLSSLSLQVVMGMAILPRLVCVLIALRVIEPKVQTNKSSGNIYNHLRGAIKAFKRNTKLQKLSVANVLSGTVEEVYYQFKPAFVASLWPVWLLGISRSLDNLSILLGHRLSDRVIHRFKAFRTLLFQQTVGRCILFVAASFPTAFSPVLLMINSVFFGVGQTASSTLMQNEFTDKQRATMGSLNALAGSLLFALLMFVVGTAADRIGPTKTVLYLGMLSVPSVFLYLSLTRKHEKN